MIILVMCIINVNRNVYVGFRSYLVFSSKDIIGPITPSQAGPSFTNVQSCHAEVGAIKTAESLHKNPKKGKLICTRWKYYKINQSSGYWKLDDGIPCTTCMKYIENKGFKDIIVSSQNGLVKMNIQEAKKISKPSTGLLYGK